MTLTTFTPFGGEPPSLSARIERSLREMSSIVVVDDAVRVTTHCMYPSNGLVRVTVRSGLSSIVASDNGEALGEALAAGVEIVAPDRLLRGFVKQRGLLLKSGVISTPPTPIDATPVAILHVANVAKEAAHWLYEHGGIKRKRDFRELLAAFLSDLFRDHVFEAKILGASNKPHKFANVIEFANGKKFIVDAVSNDASSINSRVVANLDVRAKNDPTIEQRIVYDDGANWASADLRNFFQVGATIVPFSRSAEVIRRIADQTRVAG